LGDIVLQVHRVMINFLGGHTGYRKTTHAHTKTHKYPTHTRTHYGLQSSSPSILFVIKYKKKIFLFFPEENDMDSKVKKGTFPAPDSTG
jgi:hypothetical protein